jgi:hypothetical protein
MDRYKVGTPKGMAIKINKSIETKDGGLTFQGEIEGPELNFLIEFALNELARKGALPFASTKTVKMIDFHDTAEQSQ